MSGWCEEEKNMFSCLEYNPHSLGFETHGIVTVVTELFQDNAMVCLILLFQIA